MIRLLIRNFSVLIQAESRTLLRGFILSFCLVLPFTFLPAVSKRGWSLELIFARFPESTLYALGFSALVVLAALIHNYNNLVSRYSLFKRPAFASLEFYGRLDGVGSVMRELETFLLGKVGNYYFRLNLVDPEHPRCKLEIVPLIDFEANVDMKKILEDKMGFKESFFLGLTITLSETQLDDRVFLKEQLLTISEGLNQMGAQPLRIDESEFMQ